MKTLAFLNVKGGVGKTTSSIAFAYILSQQYNKRVLIIDLDKQANTTRAFHCFNLNAPSVADLMVNKDADIKAIVKHTNYKNIDVIPSNMHLIRACQEVLLDSMHTQQTRLRNHVKSIRADYDYCILDCPTDINMATINGLVFTDDVLVPIKVDQYAFEGMEYVTQAIEGVEDFNPNIKLKGCFITMFQKNNLNKQGVETLNTLNLRLYNTVIRQTVKVQESTFKKPLLDYDINCTASVDYIHLVAEYLGQTLSH